MGRTTYDDAVERATVVVCDEWALVRLGIGAVIRGRDMRVVDEAASGADGLLAARSSGASLLVVGLIRDMTQVDLVRQAGSLSPAPMVLVLTDGADRDVLAELFSAGAAGVYPRSADSVGVATAIDRVLAGERAIAPSLLPTLVGVVAEGNGGLEPASEPAPGGPSLTVRERDVLRELTRGRTNREIAELLFLSEATVKTHLSNLYAKLDAQDRHDAVARALALGVLR